VIGHSVGATIGMRLVRHPNPPDAYVLLAAAAQSGERVMAWQSRRIAETQPIPSRWFRSFVERRHAADRERLMASTTPTLRIRRQTLPAAWFRSYMTHDPTADLAAIDRPVLAITGHNDAQVDPSDATTMGQLVAGVFDGETPPDLTHLLRRDDGPPGLRSYSSQLRRPPDRGVIERVATWTAARVDRKPSSASRSVATGNVTVSHSEPRCGRGDLDSAPNPPTAPEGSR
jgi:pimeloyl-ACP methyl ester carboxylesterase